MGCPCASYAEKTAEHAYYTGKLRLDKGFDLCYTTRNVHKEYGMNRIDVRFNPVPSKRPQVKPQEITG